MLVEFIDGNGLKSENAYIASKTCYSTDLFDYTKEEIDDDKISKYLNKILGSGHTSVIEHCYATFRISGISRSLTHQLVRHRIASYTQNSQRYAKVNTNEEWYVVPPSIMKDDVLYSSYKEEMDRIATKYNDLLEKGIPAEDARFVLPNACKTTIVMTMNYRSYINFFGERLCNRAQWEIRDMAVKMYNILSAYDPIIFGDDGYCKGAYCQTHGYCPEGKKSCGMMPTMSELKNSFQK